MATQEVLTHPPPLIDYNLFASARALGAAVRRGGAAWAADELAELGARLGSADTSECACRAPAAPPVLRAFDRYGNRQDKVEFHPSWHQLMALGIGAGLHAVPWAAPKPGAHVARAAGVFMLTQIESGVQCPITMTYGAVPALRRQKEIAAEWLPRIFSRDYDKSFRPAGEKHGALIGMGMTEKQGGSDLRSNMTKAAPEGSGGPGGAHRPTGHKWFMSAPMCHAFLMLAQAPNRLSCVFMPRWTPHGTLNPIPIQRLHDKLRNKSNASSEVEFDGAWALLIGEEGRGVPNIIEMGNYTRLDCAIGSAGLMRQAVAQSVHHATHRTAFPKKLADQPLMNRVLADLALAAEAAMGLALRLARAHDPQDDPHQNALR